jgi:Protein of unknown function (DUF1176)
MRLISSATLVVLASASVAVAKDQPPSKINLSKIDWSQKPPVNAVIAQFGRTFAAECTDALQDGIDKVEPQVFELQYKYSYDTASDAAHPQVIYEFPCSMGAYNAVEVFMEWEEVEGLQVLSFAYPTYEPTYVDNNADDGEVQSLKVTGLASTHDLVNPEFDPATRTLTDFSKYRGIGDAYSRASYELDAGDFVLQTYEVDASYDGRDNPATIVDYGKNQPVIAGPGPNDGTPLDDGNSSEEPGGATASSSKAP